MRIFDSTISDISSKEKFAKLLNYYLTQKNLIDNYPDNYKEIIPLRGIIKFNDEDVVFLTQTFELKLSYPKIKFFDETYENVKNKFNEKVWKKFEKEKFNELISSHNPDKEICLKLLENIDSLDFEDDYHIIKKLNLNKDKSENSKKVFDETLKKFKTFLNAEELHKLEIRVRFDDDFKDLQDHGIYYEKKFNKIFKDSKYFDNYILENLNYAQNKILEEIKIKYQKRRFTSPILTNLSNPNSATNTPSNSAPNTPNTSASNPNFNVPSLLGVRFVEKITEKKSQCTIS